jgi:hypothetical protein
VAKKYDGVLQGEARRRRRRRRRRSGRSDAGPVG